MKDRNKNHIGIKKSAKILAVVLVCTTAAASAAYGSSPEFARTDEEWAGLRDNVLEYGEIEGLIQEYNPTVQNNQYEYQKFKNDYGSTNTEVSDAYRNLAQDLYDSMSGDSEASSMIADLQLEVQAKNMQKQADQSLEDSQIYRLTYEQAEKNLAASAQANLIAYYKQDIEIEIQKRNLALLQKTLEQDQVRAQSGAVTNLTVLADQKAVGDAEKQIMELETAREHIKESLLISLGWKHSDSPVIRELPVVDWDRISSMNPETDLPLALEQNYALKINRRKLENVRDVLTRENLQETIRNNEIQIACSLQNAYDKVISQKLSYDEAVSAHAYDRTNLAIAQGRLQAGMITAADYDRQQIAEINSSQSVKQAEMELLEAVEMYGWSVRGLAAAE